MEKRLQELRKEFEKGRRQLALLDQKRQEVHHTLLRISGAIQVLEELLNQKAVENQNGAVSEVPTIQSVATG